MNDRNHVYIVIPQRREPRTWALRLAQSPTALMATILILGVVLIALLLTTLTILNGGSL